MNTRITFLLSSLMLAALSATSPAWAQSTNAAPAPVLVYSNGLAVNNGWALPFNPPSGNVISNSFVPLPGSTFVDIAVIVVWMIPGDPGNLRVSGSITSAPCAKTAGCGVTYGSFVLAPAVFPACFANYLGYDVCTVSITFPPIAVNGCPGNSCWFNLYNATTNSNDPVFWYMEGGPSTAFEVLPPKSIPSEAFELYL